jgi:hypothetical protein
MRSKIRRLEKRAQGRLITLPQPDDTTVRFPQSAMKAAFMTNVRRIRGVKVEEHPLFVAAANSTESTWRKSFVAGGFVVGDEIEDLSQ